VLEEHCEVWSRSSGCNPILLKLFERAADHGVLRFEKSLNFFQVGTGACLGVIFYQKIWTRYGARTAVDENKMSEPAHIVDGFTAGSITEDCISSFVSGEAIVIERLWQLVVFCLPRSNATVRCLCYLSSFEAKVLARKGCQSRRRTLAPFCKRSCDLSFWQL
jgi:hypothetical protein